MRRSSYKPLLFTTTMRSPERLSLFLGILKSYDGHILTDKIIEKIAVEIIQTGLYKPNIISHSSKKKIKKELPLTDKESAIILNENPQRHKESGFSRGWPSRFDTWFKFAKELGFIYYSIDEKIEFSHTGTYLADIKDPNSEQSISEQSIFLNAFAKYQRNNPFRRVLNENIPLVLLLNTIKKLNGDQNFNHAGILKLEIPILLYWKNNNAHSLYLRIKQLRNRFNYSPSWEAVLDICRKEIMQTTDINRNDASIMVDYPDDFIRKMRLTGLISLRGGGRFIDINKNEQNKVDHVLKKYSNYKKYRTEKDYFKYMSTIDKKLMSHFYKAPSRAQNKNLNKWIDTYPWETIKTEMLNLQKRHASKDHILKYLTHPIRLEFLTALAIKCQFPEVQVIPNYPVDDEGLPTSTAGGANDTGDIECCEDENIILVEVTMMEGRAQTVAEIWPISRHLEKIVKNKESAMCYFIAPSIYLDSLRQIKFVRKEYNLFIQPKTIVEFLYYLETSNILFVNTSISR